MIQSHQHNMIQHNTCDITIMTPQLADMGQLPGSKSEQNLPLLYENLPRKAVVSTPKLCSPALLPRKVENSIFYIPKPEESNCWPRTNYCPSPPSSPGLVGLLFVVISCSYLLHNAAYLLHNAAYLFLFVLIAQCCVLIPVRTYCTMLRTYCTMLRTYCTMLRTYCTMLHLT